MAKTKGLEISATLVLKNKTFSNKENRFYCDADIDDYGHASVIWCDDELKIGKKYNVKLNFNEAKTGAFITIVDSKMIEE